MNFPHVAKQNVALRQPVAQRDCIGFIYINAYKNRFNNRKRGQHANKNNGGCADCFFEFLTAFNQIFTPKSPCRCFYGQQGNIIIILSLICR